MTAPLTRASDIERLEHRLERSLGQAIGDVALIEPGDRILVGGSGGTDSWALPHLLRRLRRKAPVDFELLALDVDQGFAGFRVDLPIPTRRGARPGDLLPLLAVVGEPAEGG